MTKAETKKPSARKSVAKKSGAGASKTTAKKTNAEESTAKKVGAKKSVAKKVPAAKSAATKTDKRNATNVLFVGNSFTARYNVPQMLVDLAAARGHEVHFNLIQAGGASLRQHWNRGDVQKALSAKHYDWVVLQEQSTLPVKNATRTRENIELFVEPVKTSGAKLALYLTWARKNAPESQKALTDVYTAAGKEFGATVVPAGVAWELLLAKHDKPVLHDKDLSHPTLAGSYLAACVFLGTLFNEDATGIETELNGVSSAERLSLQKVAWTVASKRR